MPKREKTPPPSDDEPRYLVVVHPYPHNPNLLLHADRRTLALWLACCTGKDALYAMYYKPASPGMVIIEVDRYFDRFDSLLGKHLWTSFLKHPTEEDKDMASKVFWCHYNTGRLVQKNGWKRIDVEEHWFQGWSPNNNIIKHPYPKTTYCDVPAEAQTGVPLCRPLPKATFTPPAPRPRPTVGSAEWINSRSNVSSEAPASSRRRRGNHGSQIAPSDSASVVSSSAMSGIGARPPPPGQHLAQWVADQRVRRPVWASPPSTIASDFTLASSTISSSVGSRTPSALGTTPAAAPSPSRPSVPARPHDSLSAQTGPLLRPYESFDWSEEVEISIETQQDDVPTSPQSAGTSTTRAPGRNMAPPRRAPEPEGAIDPDQDYEYEDEDLPKRSTADAMKAIFDSAPASVGNNAGLHNLEEEEEDDYLAWHYPQAVQTTTRDWTPGGEDEDDSKNPWDGYDAARWERPTKVNIKGGEEWVCPEHGATCNPGICKARAHLEFMRRKDKEHEERLEAKRKREEKWKKAEEKKARKLAQVEGREASRDLPPHLAGHRYRGAGGSDSDSGSNSSELSDSPTGSGNHSPPPLSPQDNAAGAEGWAKEEPLWDDGDNEPPKVSLPSCGRSASGSNRVEGEDEARRVESPRAAGNTTNSNNSNNPTIRPQTSRAARSAAASTGGTASPPTTTTSARGDPLTSSRWPAPGQPQSASNTRSTASVWTTSTHSDRPTGPDADAAPRSGQGNGRQEDRGRSHSTGASSSTLSDHRSTGGPGAIATSPPGIFLPVHGGFPSFADTIWGDPIAAAQSSSARKSKTSTSGNSSTASRSAVGADTADGQAGGNNGPNNAEAGQESEQDTTGQNDRTGRGRRSNRRGGRRGTTRRTATTPAPAVAASTSTSQDVARPNVLDVTLPPGGPGDQWCNENVEW